MSCADRVAYPSLEVATNAVYLHGLANLECAGVKAYECGDHWHIGHLSRASSAACHTATAAALEERHARRAPPRRRRRRR